MKGVDKYIIQIGQVDLQRFFIASVVAGVLYFFVWYDNGANLDAQIAATNVQVTKAQTDEQNIKNLIIQEQSVRNEVGLLGRQVEEALKKLPTELTVSDVIKTISQVAQAAGAKIVKMSAQPRTQGEFYEKLTIDLGIQGTFHELITFLNELSKTALILKIEDFNIDVGGKDDIVRPIEAGGRKYGVMVNLDGKVVAFKYVNRPKEQSQQTQGGVNQQ